METYLRPNDNYMSKTMARLACLAAFESYKSELGYKHGAIIYRGKKKICAGHNMNTRTTYRNNLCCSIHAEMDTVTRFLNSFLKIHKMAGSNPEKIRRKMNKFSICVVRSTEKIDGQVLYMNSMPCRDCLKKLKMVGLNKVIFSDSDNTVYCARIHQIEDNELSWCGVMKNPEVLQKLKISPLINYGKSSGQKKIKHY